MTDAIESGTLDQAMLTLDVNTLTLGEMAQMEAESGQPFAQLLATAMRGGATRRLLALWVHEHRSSAQPRSWRQLGDLRVSVRPSSPEPS
jgi:hypothetical protein